MEIYTVLLLFIVGVIWGSFFNVVGRRLPKELNFTTSRSCCASCGHPLNGFDMIPLVSYFLLRGKCRYCKERFSVLYPLTELLTGTLFAFSFWFYGWSYEFIGAILLISIGMIILVTDMVYMLIPNRLLLFFLPAFILFRILNPLDPWYSSLLGALIAFFLLFLIIFISRGGMGSGDMKLMGLLGILFGIQQVLLVFFLAALIGAIVSFLLLGLRLIERKTPVPFGPYIIAGALIAYFYGGAIWEWYLGLIV